MTLRPAVLIAASWLLVSTGCGEDTPPTDTGTPSMDTGVADASPDTSPDTTPDAAPDAAVDGGASDTWTTFAMDFFATYCTECHSGGPRDYQTIDEVLRDADRIRCGVSDVMATGCGPSPAPMQFPVGGGPRPSVDERQRLVAWIDDGLPE